MDQMALKAIEGTAGAPRAPYHSITVNRLTPIIGAEVGG
ncbi:taurine dioxygenase, partial [Pseudomonas savastanoi pv. glycinea str. race 4]